MEHTRCPTGLSPDATHTYPSVYFNQESLPSRCADFPRNPGEKTFCAPNNAAATGFPSLVSHLARLVQKRVLVQNARAPYVHTKSLTRTHAHTHTHASKTDVLCPHCSYSHRLQTVGCSMKRQLEHRMCLNSLWACWEKLFFSHTMAFFHHSAMLSRSAV